MKVLMTADAVGGVWTYALELGRGLRERGVEVHLAVLGPPPDDAKRRAALEIGVPLHEGGFDLEWMDDPWADVDRGGAWLLDLERRLAPDLVHLNQLAYGALPWEAPRLVVGHSCVASWWRAVHGEAPPAAYDEYVRRVTTSLRAADLVVAPTEAMLRTFEDLYGPLPATRGIPNGRGPRGRADPPAQRLPVVLTAGRLWDEAKNARAVDVAAAELPWPVVAAGPTRGPNGAELQAGEVRSVGTLDEGALDAWLRRAAVFALPARYEPFGYGPLEAAQGGCALVLGDIPTLREVWGNAALFVDPDDHVELAAVLRQLIDDDGLRRVMAARARQRAQRYAPEAMIGGYLRAYRRLARRPRIVPAADGRRPGRRGEATW